MSMRQKTDWTILIYANGNNDLEPEMQRVLHDAQTVGSNLNVNVAIQIGRAEFELVKLIRPGVQLKDNDNWSGVRRYFVTQGGSELVESLNKANMADPRQLYQFVKWGMLSYPAERYMLVLSGHSYHCVGMITDYSESASCIMGLPEMVNAINTAANETEKKIDVLVIDACYSNSLELLYEFGMDENHAVQNVITYIVNGPIEGLPYDRVINMVQANCIEDTEVLIKNLIQNLSHNLVSFRIDHKVLLKIKQLFSDKSAEYISKNAGDAMLDHQTLVMEQRRIIQSISSQAPPIYIYYYKQSDNNQLIMVKGGIGSHFKIAANYYRLGFAQHNCWTRLLNDKPVDFDKMNAMQKESMQPLEMSPHEVYESIAIINPGLEQAQISDILNRLYQHKNWLL